MGAQEGKGKVLCEMCFAYVSGDLEACPECGAPLSSDALPADTDEQVHGDLAQANLLRMRKDFKGAEDLCLSILRRFPNNASANVLLGDIAAERQDWAQAAEWYDLALDLIPDNASVRGKLNEMRQKEQEVTQSQSVEQIGLPVRKFPWTMVGAMVGFLILVGVLTAAAFNAGRDHGVANSAPVVLKPEDTPENTKSKMEVQKTPDEPKSDTPAATSSGEIADRIASAAGLQAPRITQFAIDARDKSISLTFQLQGQSDDEWEARAKLVTSCFQNVAECQKVTLTVVREGNTVGNHNVDRSKYADAQDQAWQDEHKDNALAVAEYYFGRVVVHPDEPVTPSEGDGTNPEEAPAPNPEGASGGEAPPGEGTGG